MPLVARRRPDSTRLDFFAVRLLVGSALHLAGTFLVTIVGNVPLNEALAAVTPADPDGAARWASFLSRWTAWNHVRTVAALAAAALLAVPVYLQGRGPGAA